MLGYYNLTIINTFETTTVLYSNKNIQVWLSVKDYKTILKRVSYLHLLRKFFSDACITENF